MSMMYITLQLQKAEALCGIEEDESHQKALELLLLLENQLIKSFGNNKVAMIEIFIKPYLLMANLILSLGDSVSAGNPFVTVNKLVHELYGEESQLEEQLYILTLTFQLKSMQSTC